MTLRPIFLAIGLMLCFGISVRAQTASATATQAVLGYTATNTNNCKVEVSTSASYSPLVYAVDPTIFTNANLDGQTNTGARQFVVGQKWIAQENVSPPAITVTAGNAVRAGMVVTVTFTSQPFVVGDDIAVTGIAGDATIEDTWTRVESSSTNSFTYNTVPTGAFTSTGSLTITRANRYSLALATNTTYFYRIGNGSPTCVASPLTGSFTTMNIPNGNTWAEGPVRDNNGNQIVPTVPESRTATLVDPLTGTLIHRLTLSTDIGVGSVGWTSSYFRVCTLTASAGGFYYCWPGMGSSGTAGLYSIKSTGETHWLGFMHFNYNDSMGFHCCNAGPAAYFIGNSSPSDTTTPSQFYAIAATNAGNPPYKEVLVRATFTGNDAVDAAPLADWSTSAATALTPDPSNTLYDKLTTFDANFNSLRFSGCAIGEVYGDYITGECGSFDQGSPTWMWTFKISTTSVIALGPEYAQPTCRWCGSHGKNVTESGKWVVIGLAATSGSQTGEWHVRLASGITSGSTALSVTAPAWVANTAYSNAAAAGFMIVDSNSNMQIATTPGTSGGSVPTWNTMLNGTTSDGTVTWTNKGAAVSTGEPQNIYAFQDSGGTYWSYLQNAAGATGGGGQYNGDLFHFEDGTNECVRIVTKGSGGSFFRGLFSLCWCRSARCMRAIR